MLQTRITSLFNIKYPIIQAGMVWTSGWKLASAVSENGCLGLIGAGSMKPELLKEHIIKLRSYFRENNINAPFGVNVPLIRGDVKELIKAVIEENVGICGNIVGLYELSVCIPEYQHLISVIQSDELKHCVTDFENLNLRWVYIRQRH